MARSPAPAEDIVFEDLHGVAEDDNTTLEVDLDSEEGSGITRHARTSSDEGTPTGDDDPVFDNLKDRTGRRDAAGEDGDLDGRGDQGGEDRFSKKFQRRLDRSERLKREERTRADDAEAENDRLRKQLKKARKTSKESGTDDLERQIKQAETELETAIEGGKSADQVRLTSQLTDLKAEKIAAKYVPDDDDDDDPEDEPGRRRKSRRQNTELTDDWKDEHADWYGKSGFLRQTRLANQLDKEVFDDGYRADEPEYFEELNKRLKAKAPELFDEDLGADDDDGDVDQGRRGRKRTGDRNRRSPVASADDSARGDGKKKKRDSNKVELGQAEFANMRRFGLDPQNPAHVKEYAANKRQLEREEEQA